MKQLTKGQRFALAREARRLAMECVEGTAPKFGKHIRAYPFGSQTPHCVIGHIEKRAFGRIFSPRFDLFSLPNPERAIVTWANDFQDPQREALVFPLLALADALEASAASARKRPQRVQ